MRESLRRMRITGPEVAECECPYLLRLSKSLSLVGLAHVRIDWIIDSVQPAAAA